MQNRCRNKLSSDDSSTWFGRLQPQPPNLQVAECMAARQAANRTGTAASSPHLSRWVLRLSTDIALRSVV